MPICIECSYPVSHLYSTYSRADDRSLGKGVRLTQCPRCKRFADKYVEHDFVVLFIDLVLIKPQVYRHLLFNRLGGNNDRFDRSIIRLGVLLLLFDVYLTWARIERSPTLAASWLARTPIIVQYLFFLSLNAVATLAHHLTVRLLASVLSPTPYGSSSTHTSGTEGPILSNPSTPVFPSFSTVPQSVTPSGQQSPTAGMAMSPTRLTPYGSSQDVSLSAGAAALGTSASTTNLGTDQHHNLASTPQASFPFPPPPLRRASTAPAQSIRPLPPPSPASPTAISTALLVSSCAKLFPILLVIWGPDGSGSSSASVEQDNPSAGGMTHSTLTQRMLSRYTPTASAAAPGATGFVSSVSSSVLDKLVSSLAWLIPASVPTSYLTNCAELVGSLFSLGAADTHLGLLSNIEALYILLGCGYLRAVALAVAGLLARWTVQRVILGAVGIG
ncbi:sterol homeostasis protein [Aspergillus pseudoviridinutans]|uniref:Protein ARV n=1 Tax=Aspergillus pseudoviridinutans TaxID=1517512 RepID=A0A9P3BI82_9EURO|nr:sterol homeostasis protein [Aspergillus pseudoviridinutans]GIJ88803.1 sterol homeostasis protein [Aspergillus pseudoviridinutans]